MNYTLPPGDCGHRSGDTRRQSGPARALPGAVGLVAGVTTAPSPATVGHSCATFGPRWRGPRALDGLDHCRPQPQKSPPRVVPGGHERAWATLRSDAFLRHWAVELGSGYCYVAQRAAPKHRDNQLIVHYFGLREDLFELVGSRVLAEISDFVFVGGALHGTSIYPSRRRKKQEKSPRPNAEEPVAAVRGGPGAKVKEALRDCPTYIGLLRRTRDMRLGIEVGTAMCSERDCSRRLLPSVPIVRGRSRWPDLGSQLTVLSVRIVLRASYPTIHRSNVPKKQVINLIAMGDKKSPGRRQELGPEAGKPAAAGAGRARKEGIRCYWLIR
jgi:hypothetical protein